jgi:carbon monoxide dehydrogenase subunit G
MQLEGRYLLPASVERVWSTLLDPAVLAQCIPGCQAFQPLGDEEYEAVLAIGVAAIRGVYKGKVAVLDKQPLQGYRLDVTGSGTSGQITASGQIALEPDGEKTLVRYAGEYHVAGPIAGVGQRLFQPVVNLLTSQFFRCVEQRLKAEAEPLHQ